MKIKYFEYIAIWLSVFLACIFIGNAAREYSIRNGADEFTINLFFWGGIGLGVLIFVFVILFLDPIVNWIVKRLGAFAVDRDKPEIATFKTAKDSLFTFSFSKSNVRVATNSFISNLIFCPILHL